MSSSSSVEAAVPAALEDRRLACYVSATCGRHARHYRVREFVMSSEAETSLNIVSGNWCKISVVGSRAASNNERFLDCRSE